VWVLASKILVPRTKVYHIQTIAEILRPAWDNPRGLFSGKGVLICLWRCRGYSSVMPSDRGLGLMESCRLTRDIGSQTSGENDLPRFGALDEVKPLRPVCLFLIIIMIMGYNGVPNSSAEISSRWLIAKVT
jgi:hypothetical protein